MTAQIRIVDGLVCDTVEKPPRIVGYLFAFPGHGVFAPGGKINLPLTPQQVSEHNRRLTEAEARAMESHKRIALYLVKTDEGYRVGPWADAKRWPVIRYRLGRHNIAGTRIDVWFKAAGADWWGRNTGGSDIVHCRRLKAL